MLSPRDHTQYTYLREWPALPGVPEQGGAQARSRLERWKQNTGALAFYSRSLATEAARKRESKSVGEIAASLTILAHGDTWKKRGLREHEDGETESSEACLRDRREGVSVGVKKKAD